MADIQKTIFTNANGDTIIVLPPFTTANAGNVLQINQDGTGFSWVSLTPTPPAPTYNYILLNNFISPMPATTTTDDFCNTVPENWFDENYQTDELVSTTPGEPMIDSDTPIDFSSKGIQTGTPCGIVDYNCCPSEEMPRYAVSAGDLANGTTIELWYKSDYHQQKSDSYPWLAYIGTTNTNYRIIFSVETENNSEEPGHKVLIRFTVDDGTSYGTDYNYSQIMTEQWNDGNWHHYAISYDSNTNKIYVFFDGTKVITIDDRPNDVQALFTNATKLEFAQSNGTFLPYGRFAQIAVCSECKWTDDFTAPTVAY